ncbi:hypothetical protein ONE63_002865 [Megalurothrips usitatus]|uniref:Uncharacterized protein n=1 Tax=Megalurothrips usitatus TaxID=439358 RepID=A0AAV7X6A4_9NEOP|nr:hypothetical protein ONE63_002865 [Megalurothrips usitatus]
MRMKRNHSGPTVVMDLLALLLQGSVYEQAERALKSAIRTNALPTDILNHSHNLCESFLRGIVLYIIKNKAVKEIGYTTKENQIVMVLKILGGTELWLPSFQLIFSCLLEQVELIRIKHLHQTETTPTDLQTRKLLVVQSQNFFQDLEDSVFLFQLLRKFLAVADRNLGSIEEKENHTDSNCKQKASRTIANLWRKHHQVTVPSHSRPEKAAVKANKMKFHFRDWKQSLEGHLGFIMYQYPLIATVVCECFQCLPILDQ